MILCAEIGKCTCTLYVAVRAEKPGLHPNLTCVHRDRMQKPNLRGCCGNPGICLECAQGQKGLKGLPRATHCTNPAQTSRNATPTVELCPPHPTFPTKVRARRDVHEEQNKMTIIHIHIASGKASGSTGSTFSVFSDWTTSFFLLQNRGSCLQHSECQPELPALQRQSTFSVFSDWTTSFFLLQSSGSCLQYNECQPELPALQRQPALPRVVPLLVVPTYAKRFHGHYNGQPALLNRRYKRVTAAI